MHEECVKTACRALLQAAKWVGELHTTTRRPQRKEMRVLYSEPETSRFLAAVKRLKRLQQKRERQTRAAKQRIRQTLRKLRAC